MSDCLFCKIIKKEISSTIIHETKTVLVIEDIAPKAPIHYLVIPKKHIENIHYLKECDSRLIWEMVKIAQDLANKLPGSKAFNLISNNGVNAGQAVFHLHWHFLSGKNIYTHGLKL